MSGKRKKKNNITTGITINLTYDKQGLFYVMKKTPFKNLRALIDPTNSYNLRSNSANLLRQPNCQCPIEEERIAGIQKDYLENPDFWECNKEIIIGIIDKKRYIIDGQHRINAFANIWDDFQSDNTKQPKLNWDNENGDFVKMYYYNLKNMEELHKIFNFLNRDSFKNKIWVDMENSLNKINYQVLVDKFIEDLKNYILAFSSEEQKTIKYGYPFFSRIISKAKDGGSKYTLLEFRNKLIELKFFNGIKDSNEAIDLLFEFNNDYCYFYSSETINVNKFNHADRPAIKNKFFCGVKKCNFLEYIKYRLELIDNNKFNKEEKEKMKFYFNHIHQQNKNEKKKKKKIPKQLRNLVWDNQEPEKMNMICLCCNKIKLNCRSQEWHAGHIISEKNGGDTLVPNLTPICNECNKFMGADNWDVFVLKTYGIERLIDMNKICKNELIVSDEVKQKIKKYSEQNNEIKVSENHNLDSINTNESIVNDSNSEIELYSDEDKKDIIENVMKKEKEDKKEDKKEYKSWFNNFI